MVQVKVDAQIKVEADVPTLKEHEKEKITVNKEKIK